MTPRIGIVGHGNVGSHLCQRLIDVGHSPIVVVSRSKPDIPGVKVHTSLADLGEELDIIFTTVSDDRIAETFAQLEGKSKALVHCSGSTPLVEEVHSSGVLYPFQTFTKGFEVNWDGVPFFVEASNEELKELLLSLGNQMSGVAIEADTEQRRRIHLAGVIGNNFTNHLLQLCNDVIGDANQEFSIIQPLIAETVRKAFALSPEKAQTGPAKRGDNEMIRKQVEMLDAHPELKQLYLDFVSSIQASTK